MQNLGALENLLLGLRILACHDGVLDFLLFWIVHYIYSDPHHGSLSLYTKLEGSSIARLEFYSPQYMLWMISRALA
jgi:hypothetical protein